MPRRSRSHSVSQHSPVATRQADSTDGAWRSKLALRPSRTTHLAPGLYIIATPIGHAEDITLRALDVLEMADIIACEDTRVTAKLLDLYGITAQLLAYHDHNAAVVRPKLLERLSGGETVGLVSDAGTPLVSDPGYRLVKDAQAAGHRVFPIPGPSSIMAALMFAGLPCDRFFFAGFLPPKSGARRSELEKLRDVPSTLIFFESARRLPDCLADLAAVLGNRDAAVMREITKLYEESRRAPLEELAAHYAETGPPKGEVVLCVGPPAKGKDFSAEDMETLLKDAMMTMSVSEAAARIAKETGQSRRIVYQLALSLKDRD